MQYTIKSVHTTHSGIRWPNLWRKSAVHSANCPSATRTASIMCAERARVVGTTVPMLDGAALPRETSPECSSTLVASATLGGYQSASSVRGVFAPGGGPRGVRNMASQAAVKPTVP